MKKYNMHKVNALQCMHTKYKIIYSYFYLFNSSILFPQLKVYEDDFRKERCDKQVLQRLLKSRNTTRDPVLVHRCNNVTHYKGSFESTDRLSKSGSSREQNERNMEEPAQKHCIGYEKMAQKFA